MTLVAVSRYLYQVGNSLWPLDGMVIKWHLLERLETCSSNDRGSRWVESPFADYFFLYLPRWKHGEIHFHRFLMRSWWGVWSWGEVWLNGLVLHVWKGCFTHLRHVYIYKLYNEYKNIRYNKKFHWTSQCYPFWTTLPHTTHQQSGNFWPLWPHSFTEVAVF